jgi:hypothetical protein
VERHRTQVHGACDLVRTVVQVADRRRGGPVHTARIKKLGAHIREMLQAAPAAAGGVYTAFLADTILACDAYAAELAVCMSMAGVPRLSCDLGAYVICRGLGRAAPCFVHCRRVTGASCCGCT